ncbi:hypothetical protein MYX84_08985, partial [Acidobacteria bacterium AH-259-O06]|nr:hypothetical protein [Acidobacteria bacterium AH-259-O06]
MLPSLQTTGARQGERRLLARDGPSDQQPIAHGEFLDAPLDPPSVCLAELFWDRQCPLPIEPPLHRLGRVNRLGALHDRRVEMVDEADGDRCLTGGSTRGETSCDPQHHGAATDAGTPRAPTGLDGHGPDGPRENKGPRQPRHELKDVGSSQFPEEGHWNPPGC